MYDIELNKFTVEKMRNLKCKEENVDKISEALEQMLSKRSQYHMYLECMEIYDKVQAAIKMNMKTGFSNNFNARRSIIRPRLSIDSKNFMVLKKIFVPIYTKTKKFKIDINQEQFRILVGCFFLLFERMSKIAQDATNVMDG